MATKYPIILVHGIILKDFKFIKAFGRIEKTLITNNYKVYTADIDGFGTIETNALQLKEYILNIMKKENVDKVNIIAHSKGGLDSKYMIKHLDMENNVASLTTLCTPHKGSPIADWLLKLPKWMMKFIAFWINFGYRIFGDKMPNALEVCKELQEHDIEYEAIDLTNSVYCQSYSTTLKRARDDFVMGIPMKFLKNFEKKDSDGLVTSDSSKFGHYKGEIEDSISHTEIVDFMASKKTREKIIGFYLDLCNDLSLMGF